MLTATDPLPHRPRRVGVAGVSGSGKTTLALRISAVTGGQHTEIDALFHGAGWVPRPEFLDDVHAMIAAESWTTEWQYDTARPLLADAADLMVWVDPPFWRVTLPRVIRRTLRRRMLRQRLWNGNVEPALHTIFTDPEHIVRWSFTTRHKYTERIPALDAQGTSLVIVRLRSQGDIEHWLAGPLATACR